MADNGIKFSRRESKEGFYYFISNQGEKTFDGWITLSVKAESAALFNPLTGRIGLVKIRAGKDGSAEIYLRMLPGESMIISTFNATRKGDQYTFYDPYSSPLEITGTWKVDFTDGGPVFPASKEIRRLTSWTEFGGDDPGNFSGTARYSINLNKPSGKADAWLLDFGRVAESARVTINGRELATLIGPVFQLIIDKKLLKGKNTLEIKVSNLMANRIAWMDRNNIEWKKFYNINMAARMKQNTKNGIFDASSWKPLESGLIGPVTITPLRKAD
jgi:hypothetical protein